MVAMPDRFSKTAVAVAIVVCLSFAAYTNHAWEDFFITFRASLNLITGHGLVYQPGERVHSFTSPLGTLLPALFAFGDGPSVETRALWLFRLTSVAALGCAIGIAHREFLRSQVAPWAASVATSLWIFDPKIVDFSINGMETALLIFFVVLTWLALTQGAKLWPVALGFAGLQWTRPDGFVFFGALSLAWLCWGEKPLAAQGQKSWQSITRAVALGVVIYLPWVLFAWLYYGSPIPHTIVAKQFHHPVAETIVGLVLYPLRLLGGHVAMHDIFMPAYFYFGGWPGELVWFARLLGSVAALSWLWPGVKPAGRTASFALFLGGFYLEYIPGSPWYFPGWQVLACIAWAYLLDALGRHAAQNERLKNILPRILRTAGLVLVAMQLTLLVAVAWQMRVQQSLIENNHRHKIGDWLQTHASPTDRVYLEPLGYIGFYSRLKMLDNPGLSSPEVVAARQAGQTSHGQIIQALRPEWLVLRPDQVRTVDESSPHLLSQEYRLAQVFDARAQLDAVRFLPGRGYLDFDARFIVYSRVTSISSHDAP
jgi:hypothetical protein